jgi:ribulose-phosphate 3-epimerase
MVKIAPSILSADFATLGEEVRRVERAGADWVHVDVMDGSFVPNITIGPGVVKSIRPHTKLPLDVHLMIVRPENFVETLLRIKGLRKGAGISINPATPFEKVRPFMEHVDLLLIMTVNPGFGGQPFIPECLEKIRQAREYVDRHHLNTEIEVDGGINAQTGRLAVQAGASVLAAGNALFGAPNMSKEIADWKRF